MSIIKYNPELTAWSPFDRLTSLRELLDSAFQLAGAGSSWRTGWIPALDIYEDDEKITVQLEAAGMKAEDFNLSLHEGALTISGERKQETEKREGESFRQERLFGSFSRTVSLPAPVQGDKVRASYKDGVLTVTLPKAEEARPKKIAVKVE